MIECMRNAAREHMTLDEQISFGEEKSKNIKLKAEPQTFVDIKNSLEKLKNHWIPVIERLPEEPKVNPVFYGKYLELYLVTIKYGSSEQDNVYPFRAFWNGINFTDGMNILDVIAWMPLPEPYRESEE